LSLGACSEKVGRCGENYGGWGNLAAAGLAALLPDCCGSGEAAGNGRLSCPRQLTTDLELFRTSGTDMLRS